MRKRLIIPLAALLAAGACAVLWARSDGSRTLSMRFPAAQAWPADQCWSWTFPFPDRSGGDRIGLRLRQKSAPLPPGTSPKIGGHEKAMRTAESEGSFATGMIGRSNLTDEPAGVATVQLLDLSEIGAVSSVPERPLRVLAKLSVGGNEVKLSSGLTILNGKGFAGCSFRNEGTWANGELYLMSFWIYGDGSVTQYDVLVEQSADRPAHEPRTETDRPDETVLVMPSRLRARPAVEYWPFGERRASGWTIRQ